MIRDTAVLKVDLFSKPTLTEQGLTNLSEF